MLTASAPVAFVVSVSIAVLSGCLSGPPKPIDKLRSWFDVQREYAAVLDEQFGKNSVYRVVPVIGPVYKVGSPLRPGTPSLLTDACAVETTLPQQDMGQLPLVKSSKTFGIGLSMPDAIRNVLLGVAGVGARVDNSGSMELNYSNLKHESLSEEDIRQILKRPRCRNAIQNQSIVLVRGYIRGGLKAMSDSSVDIDSTAKLATIGEFSVKYVDKGGFSFEDQQLHPRFVVITEIQIATHAKTTTLPDSSATSAASGVVWRVKSRVKDANAPNKSSGGDKADEIAIKYSRPSDGSVKALYSDENNQRKK